METKGRACTCFASPGEHRHPLFVYLCAAEKPGADTTIPSKIGVATNPLLRERQLNGMAPGYSDRGTRRGAPHWRLKMVIGPLAKGAVLLKQNWVKSRTLECRLVAGLQFACQINLGSSSDIRIEAGHELTVYVSDMEQFARVIDERETQLSKRVKIV